MRFDFQVNCFSEIIWGDNMARKWLARSSCRVKGKSSVRSSSWWMCFIAIVILTSPPNAAFSAEHEKNLVTADSHSSGSEGGGWSFIHFGGEKSFQPTLCKRAEMSVFACTLKNAKIISLCASRAISAQSGVLVYRYGDARKKILMQYPSKNVRPQNCFKQQYEDAQLGFESALSFWLRDSRYSIFMVNAYNARSIAGLVVDKNEAIVSFQKCTEKSISYLSRPGEPLDLMDFASVGVPSALGDISSVPLEYLTTGARAPNDGIVVGNGRRGPDENIDLCEK